MKHSLMCGALCLFTACSQPATRADAGSPADAAGFPSPRVAGTPDTDAIADAPARCGQPAHSWLRSPELGLVVAEGEVTHFTSDYLSGLAITAGLSLPREPYYDAKSKTITYRTQNRGVLVDATAMVAWPYGLPLDAPPAPVLLLLHGTQGFTDGCSLDATEGARLLISYFASLGYITVAPDYLGLKASGAPTGFPHPYLVGQATAIASLDAIRAAGRLPPSSLDEVRTAPRVVFVGGSQGGHAGLWVDRLAPYYAPELALLGGVVTVPPADLLGEAERALTSVVDATANVLAVLAASSDWYAAGDRLNEVLKPPYDVDVAAALAASCDPSDGIPTNAALAEVFQSSLLDAAANHTLGQLVPFGCMFAENGLTTTSIPRIGPSSASYGMLFVVGEADALVHTPIERDAFTTLCNAGIPMKSLECAGATHTQATAWSLPEIVDFVEARVNGETFESDCTMATPARCRGSPSTDGGA